MLAFHHRQEIATLTHNCGRMLDLRNRFFLTWLRAVEDEAGLFRLLDRAYRSHLFSEKTSTYDIISRLTWRHGARNPYLAGLKGLDHQQLKALCRRFGHWRKTK